MKTILTILILTGFICAATYAASTTTTVSFTDFTITLTNVWSGSVTNPVQTVYLSQPIPITNALVKCTRGNVLLQPTTKAAAFNAGQTNYTAGTWYQVASNNLLRFRVEAQRFKVQLTNPPPFTAAIKIEPE